MDKVQVANPTFESMDNPVPFKIEIDNGVSLGFKISVGFWLFSLIFFIILMILLRILGVSFISMPIGFAAS